MTLTELQALSPDELRVMVAKLAGWYLKDELWWHDKRRTPCLQEMLPSYPSSLDSCREFEDAMTDEEYNSFMAWMVIICAGTRILSAPAISRCQAYILAKATKTEGAE